MRFILLVSLVLLGCRVKTDVVRSDLCDRPCFVGDQKLAGVGACGFGRYGCEPDTENACLGSGSPSLETCDGVDNDCNGKIDELTKCCKNPAPELCDGRDNDCDGKVDEAEDFDTAFCYSGLKGTAGVGPCRPGVWKCIDRRFECYGEVAPEAEVCNSRDDDCDGEVDEDLKSRGPVDVLVVLDTSCSMGSKIEGIKQASVSFATQYDQDSTIKWGLVTAPDMDLSTWGDTPRLFKDLGTAGDFSAAMALQGPWGSGYEPVLDALADICDLSNPFGISWTYSARRVVIVFSDEEPDSHRFPKNTPESVSMACAAIGQPLHLFVPLKPLDPGWAKLAQQTGGRMMEISDPSLASTLTSLLPSLICR